MKLRFFDAREQPIYDVFIDADDYWDACEKGHELLISDGIEGAADFQVLDTPDDNSDIMILDEGTVSPLMERLRQVA